MLPGEALRFEDGEAGFPALPADAPGRPRGRRGREPQAACPRRFHPSGERRPLDLPPSRLARPRADRPDHPRGDGRDRRAGDADASIDACGALAGDRAVRNSGGLQGARPQRPRVRAAAHARAYDRIFERCELEVHAVQAESGMMGGSESMDYLAPSATGQNTLVTCERGDYAADLEIGRAQVWSPVTPLPP